MSKVLLLGDAGVDIYHVGTVRGLSAEAPIPIVDQTRVVSLPAMAGNVLENLVALGVNVCFPFTTHLPKKHRLVTEAGVQLARWDEEDWCNPYTEDLNASTDTEVIVVSGYGKGAVTLDLIEGIKETNLPVLVDTKSDPYPWIEIGERVVLFPNQAEYEKFKSTYEWLPNVVLKQSEFGASFVRYGKVISSFPAFSSSPTCVNGAGDTFLAGFIAGLYNKPSEAPPDYPMYFALAAAANVVEQPFDQRTTTVDAVRSRLALCLITPNS